MAGGQVGAIPCDPDLAGAGSYQIQNLVLSCALALGGYLGLWQGLAREV